MLAGIVGKGGIKKLGYENELAYWKGLGGVGNTVTDAMVSYLHAQGYNRGTPKDDLIAWLHATHNKGIVGDDARSLVGT